ncbi:MAG TPA: LysR family transcriptional regulator [Chthoniobacterales bacterium]|nr:LysR family transcriptional regulator [Chthoniobacterales bacterium]
MMISERVMLGSGSEKFSRRSASAAQGQLRALEKSEIKERRAYPEGETAHLRLIDLNLFRVFDAMMLHRSVRKVSQMLFVSPSAVSHALSRLRQSIGDDLFTPGEAGMEPTQRALQLASAVREGLAKIALALKEPVAAEPQRTFRIWATDYPCMVILPSLVRRVAKSAPNINLRVFSANPIDLVKELEKGRADLVIGSFTELPAGLRRRRLLREDEVIVVRTGHPLTRGKITKERLLEFAHVVVEPAGTVESATDGFPDQERDGKRVSVEQALCEFQNGRIGPDSRAAVCVPNFAAVAPFLQLSDMMVMLPRRLALWAATHTPLALLDPPYASIKIEIEMLWVEGADQDRGLRWLLNELAESAGDL